MVKHFRAIGYWEAISFLLLLGVAMPLKYVAGYPLAVRLVGSLHGLLFILYVLSAYLTAQEYNWPRKTLMQAFIAAVLPFGPFIFHRRLNEF